MKPDFTYGGFGEHRWIDDAMDKSILYVDQSGTTHDITRQRMAVSEPPMQQVSRARQYSEADTKLIQGIFTTRTDSYTTAGAPVAEHRLSASIRELDRLVTELSQPAGEPGSDEYEDGYSACLALVVEFRDDLRRQEQR